MISKSTLTKVLLLCVIAAALAASLRLGLHGAGALGAVRSHLRALGALRAAHPVALATGFFLVYVFAAAASLPIATALTLLAGALFGVLEGTLIVSFASTVGALLAFLTARHVFRDAAQRRFGSRLRAVNRGLTRDGGVYLFGLRMVPVIPFFAVNLAMGLTSIAAGTFYWVSQIGMLPATLLYVNAGTRLANLGSFRGIVSPEVAGSLALLGVFPWVARRFSTRLTLRRIQRRWVRPRRFDRNLVVIGAGSAGLVSAYIAATVRAKVTLIEGDRMGGDCLNTGCVPSKALIHAARVVAEARDGASIGVSLGEPRVDFRAVMNGVHRAIAQVAPHDSVERYRGLGVDVRRGRATIRSPWLVEVGGEAITTRAIIVATGAEPIVPELPGLGAGDYLTSETLWSLQDLPRRLVVLGGGPIGCELAQAFARLGSRVTLLQRGAQVLSREDPVVGEFVRARLEADGVEVHTGSQPIRIEHTGEGRVLVADALGGEVRLQYDQLLIALGRRARTTGFGLEALGIAAAPTIETDDYLATLHPNIYACGDVVGPHQFTHAAAHQAWYAAVNALFGGFRRFRADYTVMPAVTFVDPEVARVGHNETSARAAGIDYELTEYDLGDLDRAIAEQRAAGFVRVLTVPGKDRILGATIVGHRAGELLAEFTLAMREGLGLGRILRTIHPYPTWSEANKYAAGVWRKRHAPDGILRLLQRYHAWRLRG